MHRRSSAPPGKHVSLCRLVNDVAAIAIAVTILLAGIARPGHAAPGLAVDKERE